MCDDIPIRLRQALDRVPDVAWGTTEPVELVLEVMSEGAREALDLISPMLDLILDDLSFQLQEPLKVLQFEVFDVTPPLADGDQREMLLFPFPQGYDQYKLGRSAAFGEVVTTSRVALRARYAELSDQVQNALDWYTKALHSPFDADRYIFYWICFEVLRNAFAEKVKESTRLRCGHEIHSCPTCGGPTTQVRQAATTYDFLDALGVDRATAKRLWDMRHLVHGAKSFRPDQLATLGELLQILRSVALAALKLAMEIPQDSPPIVSYGAPAVVGSVCLGGTRTITVHDLEDLDQP
ncbi:MAG: hypothetical protein HYR62_03490 [Actinobacteria bacterium]|nr:hypothetical protein [Actinomycetota bacterium]MBI3688325.1 hypothetical protein [Actinomycetota bacterium]